MIDSFDFPVFPPSYLLLFKLLKSISVYFIGTKSVLIWEEKGKEPQESTEELFKSVVFKIHV